MSEIVIKSTFDEHDCEDCGPSYAKGFEVVVDGKKFGDYEAIAHCYAGSWHTIEEVLTDILTHFGHNIKMVDKEVE